MGGGKLHWPLIGRLVLYPSNFEENDHIILVVMVSILHDVSQLKWCEIIRISRRIVLIIYSWPC